MCDPHTKYEVNWTKIVVTIVDEMFVWTHSPRHTVKWFYDCPMPRIALDKQKHQLDWSI